jgi:hypothetical protein
MSPARWSALVLMPAIVTFAALAEALRAVASRTRLLAG